MFTPNSEMQSFVSASRPATSQICRAESTFFERKEEDNEVKTYRCVKQEGVKRKKNTKKNPLGRQAEAQQEFVPSYSSSTSTSCSSFSLPLLACLP